jgi:hypothetical protein
MAGAVLCLALAIPLSNAQTNVTTTSGGTAGSVPVFTSNHNIEDSVITQQDENVGIGTAVPAGLLDVGGDGTGGLIVSGANLDPRAGYSLTPLENSAQVLEGWNLSEGGGEIDLISNRGLGGDGGFAFYDYSNSGALTPLMSLSPGASVGSAPIQVVNNATESENEAEFNGGISTNGSGLKFASSNASCTAPAISTCTVTVDWSGTAFADSNYTVTCTAKGVSPTQSPWNLVIPDSGKTTTNTTVTFVNTDSSSGTLNGLNCIAIHD